MALVLPPPSPCALCLYVAGGRPYTILDRNELTATLVTWEQRGRDHVLVIPTRHCETIPDLTDEEQAAVMADVVRATRAIFRSFAPEGVFGRAAPARHRRGQAAVSS